LLGLGRICFYQGDLETAERMYKEALDVSSEIEVSSEIDVPSRIMLCLSTLGAFYVYTEEPDLAAPYLDRALAMANHISDPLLASSLESAALSTRGLLDHLLGDTQRAMERFQEAIEGYRAPLYPWGLMRTLHYAGSTARDLGDLPLARQYYRESLEWSTSAQDEPMIAVTIEGFAELAVRSGQPERAARLLGVVEALRERIGSPLQYPIDRQALADARERAHAELGTESFASAISEGRNLDMGQVARELEFVPADADTIDRPYGLSQREVEVLHLLTQWSTDREIADQLFISPRTVAWHVSAILGKLGVSSRRQAANKARAEKIV
jgi:ATP/maltotriose-dependent transcriptional regulator MalT